MEVLSESLNFYSNLDLSGLSAISYPFYIKKGQVLLKIVLCGVDMEKHRDDAHSGLCVQRIKLRSAPFCLSLLSYWMHCDGPPCGQIIPTRCGSDVFDCQHESRAL